MTMTVSSRTVVTDRLTEFKKVDCDELRRGMKVDVKGKQRSDGSLLALKIEGKK